MHVDYIVKKACKKIYSLRVLRRAGVSKTIILKVTTIRPVLEYALPVWQSISDYLADVIESVSVKMGNYFSLWRNPIRRPWVKQTCRLCRESREDLCYKYNYGKDEI